MRGVSILMAIFLTVATVGCERDRRDDGPGARQAGREAYRASQAAKRDAKDAERELRNAGREFREGWSEAKHEDDARRKR